jgi:hypothetical protein
MLSRHCARVCGGVVLLGLLVCSAGCGSKSKAKAIVKGKVTFGKEHLTTGSVSFYGPDNAFGTATIDKDGNYEMNDAPVGLVKITIVVPKMPPGGRGPMIPGSGKDVKDKASVDPEDPGRRIPIMGERPSKIVPIPDKYGNVETSGLTYTVEKGEQTHDINLKP